MLSPFLFVGVGGSGGATLWTLRDELRHRLDEVGFRGEIPDAWQFLHIDVPTLADGLNPDLGDPLPASNYVGMVAGGITYKAVDTALAAGAETNPEIRHALAGWRPDPAQVTVPVQKGAGQYRTLGRVIDITNLKAIDTVIRAAITRLQGAGIATQLAEISELFGAPAGTQLDDPVVVVVSSMAGGTGAGTVLDVCDVLRASGHTWASDSFGFLFAPDVFNGLHPSQRRGVQANALATISELMAGFWNTGAPGRAGFEEEFALFERAGIVSGALERRGPRYPIIIGNSNGDVTFGRQEDVYRAAGKALAAWTVSPKIQDHLGQYFEAQFQSSAQIADELKLKLPGQELPLSAVGFGRMSLGRDRFARYATERLARVAVERLLHAHEVGRVPGKDFDNAAAIEEIVTARVTNFFAQSGLDERGADHNQILDALRPTGREARGDAVVEEILGDISVGMEKGAVPKKWTSEAVARANQLAGPFADAERTERLEQARLWSQSLCQRLLDLVARTAARDGFPVTLALLDRLDSELQNVMGELPAERDNLQRYSVRLEEFVAEEVGQAGLKKIVPGNPQIRAGVDVARKCMVWAAESALIDLALDLVGDIKANLIQPLRNAIRVGAEALTVEATAKSVAVPTLIETWPVGNDVPRRFTPSQNERVLLAPDSYVTEFDQKVLASTTQNSPDEALTEAVMSLIIGATDDDAKSQELISVLQNWNPTNSDVQSGLAGSGTKARFVINTEAKDLLKRSREWVNQPDTAMGSYVNESLKSYLNLDSDPTELDRRLTAFRGEFMSAVDAAKPLVEISSTVLLRTHGQDKPYYEMMFTEMPFLPGTKAREIAEDVLQTRGLLTEPVKKSFGEGDTERVDIFTVLGSPYQPVVFNSLMRPIADEWASRSQSIEQREEFWRWRRSRPLWSFIPVSPDVREAMVRGWFIARALGQLSIDKGAREVKIFSPERDAMLSFPVPLIGPVVFTDLDFLPAVLESMPLALLGFASNTDGLVSMLPYQRLRQLGEGATAQVNNVASLNIVVSTWIERGEIISSGGGPPIANAPMPNQKSAGTAQGSPSDRQAALKAWVDKRQAKYDEHFATDINMLEFFQTPRFWELRTDIQKAFQTTLSALAANVLIEGDEDEDDSYVA